MNRTHDTMEEVLESYQLDEHLWKKGRSVIAAIAVTGWVACAAGYALSPERFFSSYLVAFAFWTTLAIGALFFVMLQHLTGAAWSVTMRRMAENAMGAMPVAALLFIPVALGIPYLYEWSHPGVVNAQKAEYLNPQFFLIRAAIYFGIWSLWALKLYRNSKRQDASGDPAITHSSARWSAAGMVVLTITTCLAGFDWLMSLTPHWYSTMFGIYIYSGAGLGFVAALTVILLAFRRADVLRYSVNHEHYHDLGKWMFALTVFWAYIAFCQYLLIWYANIPEETVWYRDRLVGSWRWVAALLLVGHFFAPFLVLISRAAKRRLKVLGAAAAGLLAMHYLDLYWIAMPVFSKNGASPHWLDLATLTATGGTIAFAFWLRLRRSALAPVGDVRFEKALEFENA